MIEQKFKELSLEYNCDFDHFEYIVEGRAGSKIQISVYTTKVVYRNIPIDIKFEFGNHNLAEFKFQLVLSEQAPEFEIITRDNFTRLISFNKEIWSVKCKDTHVASSLKKVLNSSRLTEMADNTTFEPNIKGYKNSNKFYLYTKYYLGFHNKEQSLKLVLDYHKNMIDYFIEKYFI